MHNYQSESSVSNIKKKKNDRKVATRKLFPHYNVTELFAMNTQVMTAKKRPLKQQRTGVCNDDDDDDNNNGDMDAYDLKQVLIKSDLDFLRQVDDSHHQQHGISDLRHESLSHILKHNIEIVKGHGVKSIDRQLDTADDDNNNSATMLDDVGKDVHQYSQLLNAAGDVLTDHVDDCGDDAKVGVGGLFRFSLIVELPVCGRVCDGGGFDVDGLCVVT